MSFGLEVRGGGDSLIISDTWVNLALVGKQAIAAAALQSLDGPEYIGASIPITNQADMVFVHCAQPFCVIGQINKSGTIRFAVATFAVGAVVTFYTFRRQAPQGSPFGFQVFDAGGTLCFDAASKFVRVRHAVPASDIYLSASYLFEAGRTYAVLVPIFTGQVVREWFASGTPQFDYWQYIDVYGPRLQILSSGLATSGQAAFATQQIPDMNPGVTEVTPAAPVPIVIADVTGF